MKAKLNVHKAKRNVHKMDACERRQDIPLHQDVPRLFISPDQEGSLLALIKSELSRSDAAWFASAFYSPCVANLLISDFERFTERGGELRILLSTMGNINKPEYFSHLREFVPGAGLRIFHPPDVPFDENPPNFHVKAYLFRHQNGAGAMMIGSSNFSEAGFLKNIEWNYFTPRTADRISGNDDPFSVACLAFKNYWSEQSVDVTDDFLAAYRRRWLKQHDAAASGRAVEGIFEQESSYNAFAAARVRPNVPQREALENISGMREAGVGKLAVIAATGIGKTYLAAFDFQQSGFKRVLFIAHRETILRRARESFAKVMRNPAFGSILGGGNGKVSEYAPGADGDGAVFAMIQTLSREGNLHAFSPDAFDYIVVDEFHHGMAASYRKALDYFQPRFFLGLTATPERMDGRDVLALCDYNVAYEVRMLEAVDRGWLSPFQYFAVYDETNYEHIAWRGSRYDEEELDQALSRDTRTAIIARNLKKYLPSSGKIKALAFCNTVAHARYTADHLRRDHGIAAVALTGESGDGDRAQTIERLRDENDPLEVICTVDIFNEGVDIPELTHVLFLRPTQSFTVFLQQLGRGLRRAPGKNFLVVIDFIGNFRKAHVAPLALAGFASVNEYAEAAWKNDRIGIGGRLPDGCYLDADLDVQRIWDEEIRRIVQGGLSKEERLKALYSEIKGDLGEASPTLLDFLDNPHDVDPHLFIRAFGGWLRAKLSCEGALPEDEKRMLDTPGETLLKHIEMDLNPVKSYKMVVLQTLLTLPGTAWDIGILADGFKEFYLKNPEKQYDYEDMAKSTNPEAFPLARVETKLKAMPLNFLSNTQSDPFILDKEGGMFRLKDEYAPYWNNSTFRNLLRERIEYTLARYFQQRGKAGKIN